MTQENLRTHNPTENSTPGRFLQHARESTRLTRGEVAQQLCLSEQVIDALERDAYHELPGSVFVRGYLRSYAGLLKLSPDDLIKAFDDKHGRADVLPMYKTAGSAGFDFSGIAYLLSRSANYIIILVLLTLMFAWWHERHEAMNKNLSPINLSQQRVPYPRQIPAQQKTSPTLDEQIMDDVFPLWNEKRIAF